MLELRETVDTLFHTGENNSIEKEYTIRQLKFVYKKRREGINSEFDSQTYEYYGDINIEFRLISNAITPISICFCESLAKNRDLPIEAMLELIYYCKKNGLIK